MYKFHPHYKHWASQKLDNFSIPPEVIPLSSLSNLSLADLTALNTSVKKFNFALYDARADGCDELELPDFTSQLGLKELDAHLCVGEDQLTKIFNNKDKSRSFYIPYTDKPINWHSDGYYNSQAQAVYAFLLHCEQPAFEGGENSLMDPDQVFIHLMQQNPLYIKALMHDDVMTIPENRMGDELIRPETSTAIFKVLNNSHDVLMRYSMRKKNIVLNQDSLTQEALACMDEFINSDSSPSITIKLKAGQGVVCNNVLHKRTAFKDKIGSERLYYRARYYNRLKF